MTRGSGRQSGMAGVWGGGRASGWRAGQKPDQEGLGDSEGQ